MHVVTPKNAVHLPDAKHGHLPLPYGVFQRCVNWLSNKLEGRPSGESIGYRRDRLILVLLFVMCGRSQDIFQAKCNDFIDKGVGNGFSWCISKSKCSQLHRDVLHVPETTCDGYRVSHMLREFLGIAPQVGLMFRATMVTSGSRNHVWKPAASVERQFNDRGHKVLVPACEGYKSGEWNHNLRRILRLACPDFNANMASSHSLRSGGATAALQALGSEGRPLVQQMLRHKCSDSTASYTRASSTELQNAHASVGSASSSSSSSGARSALRGP